MRPAVKAYVAVLCALALPLVVVSLASVERPLDLFWFAVLLLFVEKLKSRMGSDVLLSLSALVAVATYPIVGVWGAPAFILGAFVNRAEIPLIRRLYNVTQNMLCTFVGGLVYVGLGGPIGTLLPSSFPAVLLPVTLAILTHHVANLLLLVGVVRLDTGANVLRQLRSAFTGSAVASMGYAYLGLAMAILWLGQLGPAAGFFMLVPLLISRWALAQWAAEQRAHQSTLHALAQAIETKDVYTRGHGERVSRAARMLGAELGWEGARLDAIAEAGLLHDVGKIGVPTRVLQKDGRLTEDEYEAIKTHPLHGVTLVGDIAFLEDARAGIMHHHERYDGRGYPSGLEGENIPVFARVLSISDAFDCMTSVRSYRAARPVEEAIAELVRCKGDQFDPILVDRFVAAIGKYGWEPALVEVELTARPAAAAYDHDDPTRPPQVEDRRGRT